MFPFKKTIERTRDALNTFRAYRLVQHVGYLALWGLFIFCLLLLPGSSSLHLTQSTISYFDTPSWVNASLDLSATSCDLTLTAEVFMANGGEKGPLSGARTRLYRLSDGGEETTSHLLQDTFADEYGKSRFVSLSQGIYFVVVSKPGFTRAANYIFCFGDNTSPPRQELFSQVHLSPSRPLSVSVYDEEKQPLPGATILITGQGIWPYASQTNDRGQAQFDAFPSANEQDKTMTLLISKPGYEEARVYLPPHSRDQNISSSLKRMGRIHVHVTDESNHAIPHVSLQIGSVWLWPYKMTETNDKGYALISSLKEGLYSVRAHRGVSVGQTPQGLMLRRGEEKQLELKLQPGRMVLIRTLDKDTNLPIPRAKITLTEEGLAFFSIEGESNQKGEAWLGPIVKNQAATVGAGAYGYVPQNAIFVPPFPMAGNDVVELKLERGAKISGRVVDSAGFPIVGAKLTVMGLDAQGIGVKENSQLTAFRRDLFDTLLHPQTMISSGELGVVPGPVAPISLLENRTENKDLGFDLTTQMFGGKAPSDLDMEKKLRLDGWITSKDGSFSLSPISPGQIVVVVNHPEFVEAYSQPKLIQNRDELELQITMFKGAYLTGRVVNDSGMPVFGAKLTLSPSQGSQERIEYSGSDGSFAFASVPQKSTLLVSAGDDPSEEQISFPLELESGEKKDLLVTLPHIRDPLGIRVVDDRGYPLEYVQITSISLDPKYQKKTTLFSDKNGELLFLGLGGLPLRIEATSPDYAPLVKETTGTEKNITLVLNRGETLEGEVRSKTRLHFIEGAEVKIHTETGNMVSRSDSRGEFSFRSLAAGSHFLQIEKSGYAPFEEYVDIKEEHGGTNSRPPPFLLDEECIVSGKVVDERNDVVPNARVSKAPMPHFFSNQLLPKEIVLTDMRGEFQLGSLPSKTFQIEAFSNTKGIGKETLHCAPGILIRDVLLRLESNIDTSFDPSAETETDTAFTSSHEGNVAITLAQIKGEIFVEKVGSNSEAERAGLFPGDQILKIQNEKVINMQDARKKLGGALKSFVIFSVRRKQQIFSVRVRRERVYF